MSWKDDIEELQRLTAVLRHHRTIMGYTRIAARGAIQEMRAAEGPLAAVLKERARVRAGAGGCGEIPQWGLTMDRR